MISVLKKAVIVFTLAGLLLTTACGTSTDKSASSSTANKATPAEKPDPYSKMSEMVDLRTGTYVLAEPKYPQGESPENNDVMKWIKDNMNINVKYDWTTSDQNYAYENKINLLIASNEIPDFLFLNVEPYGMNILKKLVDAGMVEDMTKIYEDYASPTLKEFHEKAGNAALKEVTFDGKLMAVPGLADTETAIPVMWTRQDWLDKAGLQLPKTVDDVINTVKTFNSKNITKNATLPTQQNLYKGDTATLDWLFGANKAYPGDWIKASDGSVVYGSVQPEVKSALLKAQEMYKNGIIEKEFALKDADKAIEGIKKNTAGIMMGAWWSTWWPLQDSVKNDSKAVWKASMISSADGNNYSRSYPVIRNFLVVKKGIKNPEAVMKLININEDAELKKLDWYNKLKNEDNAKYKDTMGPLFPFTPGAKYLDEISRRYSSIMDVVDGKVKADAADAETKNLSEKVILEKQQPLKDIANWCTAYSWTEGAAVFKKFPVKQNFPAFSGTTDLMKKNKAVLEDLEKQTFMKIIMNKASIDEFDKFVTQWKQLGGDDITKEINQITKK